MRSFVLWGLAFAAIAGYIGVLVRTHEPDLVDPGSVSVTELKALVPESIVPSGYGLAAENGGRQPWGMPGEDSWRATYAERLFKDSGSGRIAVRIIVTGTPTRGGYIGSYDALCSRSWVEKYCDPQYNANRYVPVEQSFIAAGGASRRECHTELCGLSASRPMPSIRNESFVRAGIIVTVSTEAADDASLPDLRGLLAALDERVSKLATSHGVAVSRQVPSKR
jgi:hypothetical protein